MPEPRLRYARTPALYGLMAVNVLVFAAWQLWGLDRMTGAAGAGGLGPMGEHFLVSLESARDGRLWTLATTMFSHVETMHLIVNLLALWVFGQAVEQVLGPVRFVLLYLLGGLAGSLGFLLWAVVTGSTAVALGASGAVMAVAVVFGLWFPQRTLLLNLVIPVPAWLAVVIYLSFDLFGLIGGAGVFGQPTAYAAHLGGALLGLLWTLPHLVRGRRRRA